MFEPAPTVRSESELLFLAVQSAAPSPGPTTVTVNTGQSVTHRTTHPDQFGTQFLEIGFGANPVVGIGPRAVSPGEPVDVTIRPEASRYAVSIEPSSLDFNPTSPPTLRFTFGLYGDRSVADGSTRYASRAAYGAALRIWLERAPGEWERVDASSTEGADAVAGPITTGGRYALAAPR